MPFSYFDHEADIGIIGQGPTLEAAFEAAAEATFSLMTEVASVPAERHLAFTFQESDPELALVTWLNRLLAEARAGGLILGKFRLQRRGADWFGEAWGAPWQANQERGVEVKGATLTALSVRPAAGGWEARCVVDV